MRVSSKRSVGRCQRIGFFLWAAVCSATLSFAQGGSAAIPRPAELEKDVEFWVRVYSQITTNEGYLHDERELSVTYETLRFAPNTPSKERQAVVDEARKRYVAILNRLAATARGTVPADATPVTEAQQAEDARVRALWGDKGVPERLDVAVDGIRFQLGQADRFHAGLVRAGAWEAHIAETIANMGLPPEIAALPHVESSFNPSAYSKVGAAGLWQFMRSTGRRYLRIDNAVDERMDPFRSTEAAAQLLSYNYRLLNSWPLALTAYNHGAAGMRRAVEATGTNDYVRINRTHRSPSFGFASRNFYPSFLAALTIDQAPEKYFGPIERQPEAKFTEVALPAFVRMREVERTIAVDRNELRALNPALLPTVWNGTLLIPRGYRLRLPHSQGSTVWTTDLLAQRLPVTEQFAGQVESRSHRVQGGQTLASIAKRYGMTKSSLASLNGLSADASVKKGRVLRLPDRMPALVSTAAAYAAAAPVDTGATTYVVKRGDTLSAIAGRVGVPENDLLRLNSLRSPNYIFEGQRLRLASADKAEKAAVEAVLGPAATEPSTVEQVTAARTGGTAPAAPVTKAERESAEDAAAVATAVQRSSKVQPVSQAEALGPALVPSAEASLASDTVDYSVGKDGTIRVAGAETIGHYADWLGISASRLRQLNKLKSGQALLLGRRVTLDLSKVKADEFEKRRRDYHASIEANFFAAHRIQGTEIYVVRRGDSLWSITQKYAALPVWLLQQYNPDLDLADMRPGAQVIVPRVEKLATPAG